MSDFYQGHPSCTRCGTEYLGQGTCGPCLYVRNLQGLLAEIHNWIYNEMPNELIFRIGKAVDPMVKLERGKPQ